MENLVILFIIYYVNAFNLYICISKAKFVKHK